MKLLNFSHPLTDDQRARIAEVVGVSDFDVIDVPVQFDHARPYAEQVRGIVDQVKLAANDWQKLPVIVVPPSFAPGAAVLLADLHGRIGNFPPIVRVRPVAGSTPTRYEIAEIVDLNAVRDEARRLRQSKP